MDDVAFDHLEKALAMYGTALFEDRPGMFYQGAQTTGNVLRDLCGESCGPDRHGPEIAALVQAVDGGVPSELRGNAEAPSPFLGDQLVARLTNRGIDGALARWAVRSWARVLHVGPLRISMTSNPSARREPVHGQARAARVAGLAAQTAAVLGAAALGTAEGRAGALATAAAGLATSDPDRSAGLLDQAERVVQAVTRHGQRALAEHAVAIAVSTAYPRRAELVLSVNGCLRDHALGRIATGLGRADPDRAWRLAEQITDPPAQMHAKSALLTIVAGSDLDRAVDLARWQTSGYWLAETLSGIAAVDPARTAELAGQAADAATAIDDGALASSALAGAARALHPADPERAVKLFDQAETLARSAADPAAWGSLAIALAASDPDRAIEIARARPDDWYTSGEIAKVIARSRPPRALALAQSITPQTPQLADIAIALADATPEIALTLARSITNARCREAAIVGVARTLAEVDPARAARLLADREENAELMPDGPDKVAVLVEIAAGWSALG